MQTTYQLSSNKNIDCPACGARSAFFLVALPRNPAFGPFRMCRMCRHWESIGTVNSALIAPPLPKLTDEQRQLAHRANDAVRDWCALLIIMEEGARGRNYAAQRGITDATLVEFGIGYHPRTVNDTPMTSHIFRCDSDVYAGLSLAQLTSRQGRVKNMLQDALVLPYQSHGVTHMIRTRLLDPSDERKYFSPAGDMFCGGKPIFFLHNVLSESNGVILTEGEIKALLATQAWRAGDLSVPAVAQPGISILQAEMIEALAGKTVYLLYDSEARKDPFGLSPGERYTILNGEKLTGTHLYRQRTHMQAQVAGRKKLGLRDEDIAALEARIAEVTAQIEHMRSLAITVRVVRLPRKPNVKKVDLDDFLLDQGAIRLQSLLDHAPLYSDWYDRHGECSYRYTKGSMWRGDQLVANYQARVVEDIISTDGNIEAVMHRLALCTPSGTYRTVDIPAEVWADDRKALLAIRTALQTSTAIDTGLETLAAIKQLSLQGDPPIQRIVYRCTGWQQIDSQWHWLANDGAIGAHGPIRDVQCQIVSGLLGNAYVLCDEGSVAKGRDAFMALLRGDVCEQAEALLLASMMTLPLLHRFLGTSGRPALYIEGKSGGLKTAIVRVFLSLYGPQFTQRQGDGAPLAKWDSTSAALELYPYTYRDAPCCIDDYKLATATKGVLSRFLHAYGESTNRSRMTRERTADRTYPARGIVIITGEDRPTGDAGQLARTLLYPHSYSSVDKSALLMAQAAGEDGHLAAFWREFMTSIAAWLDKAGPDGVYRQLKQLDLTSIHSQDSHARIHASYRQIRVAWLVLLHWLRTAGYIDDVEATSLDAAHIAMRHYLTDSQRLEMDKEQASNVFLRVLSEMLASGECTLEDNPEHDNDQGQPVFPERSIGFWHSTRHGERYICLRPNRAFALVQKRRTEQHQPIPFTASAIGKQLLSDGYLARASQDKHHSHEAQIRRSNGLREWVWVLLPRALGYSDDDSGDSGFVTNHETTVTWSEANHAAVPFDENEIVGLTSPMSPMSPKTITTSSVDVGADAQLILDGFMPHRAGDMGDLVANSSRRAAQSFTSRDQPRVTAQQRPVTPSSKTRLTTIADTKQAQPNRDQIAFLRRKLEQGKWDCKRARQYMESEQTGGFDAWPKSLREMVIHLEQQAGEGPSESG